MEAEASASASIGNQENSVNATIGVLFGMETTFPPALVDKINGMKLPGITAEAVSIGGIRMDEPQRYRVIVDRISQERRPHGHDSHQQSLLVERGRQVFQRRIGHTARRRDSADGDPSAQGTPRGHDRSVDA